ncbi:hypothetical protein ODJ79_03325 [Actinoplanes sp. KI2]|uniref:hypothetical protein n=1 Tax=Actinoplanes sp. KI2 TaxID=2983315 RepID=UPI0021D5A184|nr:hypothetical protein [Actinoplanes sp. KI2]MCU7722738.1 hypothetical protein [Actinoplanes sp. KI2]
MFVTARAARIAVATFCALAVTAACSDSKDDDKQPDRQTQLISATTMRGALLQASDVGPTWTAPDESADPETLVSICGGTTPAPPAPPGGEVISAPLVDEGEKGAQTLEQIALVYGNKSGADAALAGLRGIADGCQKAVNVPAAKTSDRNEPAYTENVSVTPLNEEGWTGFVVIRHKSYEAAHPGTADTAVTVAQTSNVVLVDAYAIYQLNNASPAASFDSDWKKLVGTVVQRVG